MSAIITCTKVCESRLTPSSHVVSRLHKTQDLLYESTQDILKLRQRWRENEIKWQSEKNSLVLELDKCRGRLNVNRQDHPDLEASYRSTSNDVLTIDSTAKYRLETKVSSSTVCSTLDVQIYGYALDSK